MIRYLRRRFDEALEGFLRRLFDAEAVVSVHKESRFVPEADRMPLYQVSAIALISPSDRRVHTIPLSRTYDLEYKDRLQIVVDYVAGE